MATVAMSPAATAVDRPAQGVADTASSTPSTPILSRPDGTSVGNERPQGRLRSSLRNWRGRFQRRHSDSVLLRQTAPSVHDKGLVDEPPDKNGVASEPFSIAEAATPTAAVSSRRNAKAQASPQERILRQAESGSLSPLDVRPHCISITVHRPPQHTAQSQKVIGNGNRDESALETKEAGSSSVPRLSASLGLVLTERLHTSSDPPQSMDGTDTVAADEQIQKQQQQQQKTRSVHIKYLLSHSIFKPTDVNEGVTDEWIKPDDELVAINDLAIKDCCTPLPQLQEYLDELDGTITIVLATTTRHGNTSTETYPFLFQTILLPYPAGCTPTSTANQIDPSTTPSADAETHPRHPHDLDRQSKAEDSIFVSRRNRLQLENISDETFCAHPRFPPGLRPSTILNDDYVLFINSTLSLTLEADDATMLFSALSQSSRYLTITTLRSAASNRWARLRRSAVAVGGGALVGVGAAIMVTPLHPIGHAMAIGGVGLLGTEFEAPRRMMQSARNRLSGSKKKQQQQHEENPQKQRPHKP